MRTFSEVNVEEKVAQGICLLRLSLLSIADYAEHHMFEQCAPWRILVDRCSRNHSVLGKKSQGSAGFRDALGRVEKKSGL
jgi:hypothetical protein